MSYRIIVEKGDGSLEHIIPSLGGRRVKRGTFRGRAFNLSELTPLWWVIGSVNEEKLTQLVITEGETLEQQANRIAQREGGIVVLTASIPTRRWRSAWRLNAGTVVENLVEARKIRTVELKAERDRLRADVAKLKPIAEAVGDTASVYVAEQNGKDLQTLDDAAIQTSVDGVNDLTALDTHEPAALTTVKNRALPTAEELAAALRVLALALFSTGRGTISKLLRVVTDVIKDENNLVRTRLRAQDTVIENATTLANLKSAWAAMALANPVPNRTLNQLKTAIDNRMNDGTLDDGVV